jgi:hypothetical protein
MEAGETLLLVSFEAVLPSQWLEGREETGCQRLMKAMIVEAVRSMKYAASARRRGRLDRKRLSRARLALKLVTGETPALITFAFACEAVGLDPELTCDRLEEIFGWVRSTRVQVSRPATLVTESD